MYVKIKKVDIDRIAIIRTNCKMTLQEVVAMQGADFVINGGLYDMKTGKVNNIPLRIGGVTAATSKDGYWVEAWRRGPDIQMVHSSEMKNYPYVVACSTMIKDGNYTIFTYTPAQDGIRGRTAFGTNKDEVILFATTDRNGAMTPKQLRDQMHSLGCKDAIMLDCGGSSQGYFNGKYVQYEERKVCYWICVWLKKSKKSKYSTAKINAVCPYKAPTTIVRRGSKGEHVKWIQWHLNVATAAELVIDGDFGGGTKAAVERFQRKIRMNPDGVVEERVREKLKEAIK